MPRLLHTVDEFGPESMSNVLSNAAEQRLTPPSGRAVADWSLRTKQNLVRKSSLKIKQLIKIVCTSSRVTRWQGIHRIM